MDTPTALETSNVDAVRVTQAPPASRRWLRWLIGLLLVLIVLVSAYYGSYIVLRGPLPVEVELIAHRGGKVDTPENTLAAFQHAIDVGVDWIEMDVQRTHDGALVVIHDETVDRTTDGTGMVGELTLEEIRTLDAGDGEMVPTFDEVIAQARQIGIGLMPEVKSPHLYPGMETEMIDALVNAGYDGNTVVQSFDPDVLQTILESNPAQRVCRLTGLWQFDLRKVEPAGATTLCPMAEMVLLNPWMIRQAHREGRDVYIWFGALEHPMVVRLLRSFGADGMMVDDLAANIDVLARK